MHSLSKDALKATKERTERWSRIPATYLYRRLVSYGIRRRDGRHAGRLRQGSQNLPKFEGTLSFYTWLYRIVVNLCTIGSDVQRRRYVDYDDAISHQEQLISPDRPCVSVHRRTRKRAGEKELREMQLALDKLSPDHREILVLREFEGLAYEEIAEILNVVKGTVSESPFMPEQILNKRSVATSTKVEGPLWNAAK